MDKLKVTKKIASLAVGYCVGGVITAVIRNNVAHETPKEKVEIAVGSYVVGAMVAAASREWTNKQIDAVVEWWTDAKAENEKAKAV